MCTKSKKAITALNKHLNEIHAISNTQEGNTWKAALKDIINLYIGENSSISRRLNDLVFTRETATYHPSYMNLVPIDVYEDSKKQDFINLINTAIRHVKSNGVYKDPDKKNLISHWDNIELIGATTTALISIIVATYWIGNYFGRLEKDREIMQTENKVRDVEAQIEPLRRRNSYLIQSVDSLSQNIDSLKREIKTLISNNESIKK